MGLIEDRFIDEALEAEGRRMLRNQGIAISSATQQHTGRLLNDRHVRVQNGIMNFTHADYERFLDLRKLRRNGHYIKRKPRHIHNRFVFGTYSAIARRLMYGLTEEVTADIRRRFQETSV